MRHIWLLTAIGSLSLFAAGCGGSGGDDVQAEAASGEATAETGGADKSATDTTDFADTPVKKVQSDGRTPEQVVEALMGAMVAHDQDKLDAMVTAKTRDANTLKAEAPHGVRFKVGEVQRIGDDNAHVVAAWFYPNADGGEDRVMTLWMLRREPEGFRVYGSVMMVPQLAKYDGGKVVFDFEDAEQVAATENRVYALLEKERGASAAASVAEKNPDQSSVRQQ